MIRLHSFALAALLLIPFSAMADDKTPAAPPAQLSQEELEKQLSEDLTNHVMIGQFTTTGAPTDQPAKEDRYTLGKVYKLKNGLWSFETRMKTGEKEVKFTMAFPIKWAGDTPMITLTDLPIPGMGIFTARILVYRGQYAGTWSAGDHGGLMFGRIVKADEVPPSSEKPAEKPPAATN
jgi:hypothetical protein